MARTAQPDGYTISQLTISAFRAPHMQKVDWNPVTELHLHHRPRRLHVRRGGEGRFAAQDVPRRAEYAKANPGKLSYATPGTGTSLHLAMEEVAAKPA